jgi:hypothetical protein
LEISLSVDHQMLGLRCLNTLLHNFSSMKKSYPCLRVFENQRPGIFKVFCYRRLHATLFTFYRSPSMIFLCLDSCKLFSRHLYKEGRVLMNFYCHSQVQALCALAFLAFAPELLLLASALFTLTLFNGSHQDYYGSVQQHKG